MKASDFISHLKFRYPKLNKEPFHITDLEQGLKQFSSMHLEKLWEAFKDNYIIGRSPRWADVNKIAHASGITRGTINYLKDSYNICQVCKTPYSAEGRICPVCHKMTEYVVHAGKPPQGYYMCKADCGGCKYYLTDDAGGAFCDHFATDKTNKLQPCKSCVCKHCCFETYAIDRAMAGDKVLYEKLNDQNKWEDRRPENTDKPFVNRWEKPSI